MRSKGNKKELTIITGRVKNSFTNERLTHYAGLGIAWDYISSKGLIRLLNKVFPTIQYNSTKFSNVQLLLSIVLAHLSGIHRLSRIEVFTGDPLVKHLLGLKSKIEDSTIKDKLLKLGEGGAFLLQEGLFSITRKWLCKSNLSRITIDCDSTVSTVYGKQEGADRGYNPHKKGANSYHPLLCYCSEMKLLINSWFRTGSAYTSNGICEFLKQTLAVLPEHIKQIFFRADSGFFSGELFDFLEEGGHQYLVKVKLKNLTDWLKKQEWIVLNRKESISEFEYKAKDWKVSRRLKAIRILTGFEQYEVFGELYKVPKYEYFCYCSNLKGMDAKGLHGLYGARAESENWIEHTKEQLHASQTVTDDFHVNDILWQLAVLGYNLSVMMRYEADHRIWRQEPLTFMRWFIIVPGKVVHSARKVYVKMSAHYQYAINWHKFATLVASSA
jgi:hypothetical protein